MDCSGITATTYILSEMALVLDSLGLRLAYVHHAFLSTHDRPARHVDLRKNMI